jgi:hypothetical protein
MTEKKDTETIRLKKSTLIIAAVVILAVITALATLYYVNQVKNNQSKDEKITTEELLSMEPVDVRVTAIIFKKCKICMNMTQVVQELKQTPFVNVKQTSIIIAESAVAKRYITMYDIKKLPALILEGENVSKLPLKGFREVEGGAVLEEMPPPYVDLEQKNIAGLVEVTYLTDDSCEECYDVEQHRDIMMMAFGVYINEEEMIDISSAEGKELLEKYDITKVPTILMSEEAGKYQTIQLVWDQLGTIEEDGTYVFRGFEMTQDLMYKDLETNQLVNTSQLQNEE